MSIDRDAARSPVVWCRIGLAIAFLHFLASSWTDRAILWAEGSPAARPHESMTAFWAPIDWAVGALASVPLSLLGLLAMTTVPLFAVVGSRLLAVWFALLVWTFQAMDPFVLDGGDNAAKIAVLLLPFLLQPSVVRINGRPTRPTRPFAVTVHNSVVLLLLFQLLVIYFVAGLWKLASPVWQSGDALAAVLRSETYDYVQSPLVDAVARSFAGVLGSWFVIGIQVAAPIGMLWRPARSYWLIGIVLMHAGILLLIGLVGFALTMVALDFLVLSLDASRGTAPSRPPATRAWAARAVSVVGVAPGVVLGVLGVLLAADCQALEQDSSDGCTGRTVAVLHTGAAQDGVVG